MPAIVITMKDGKTRSFEDLGTRSPHISYEIGFVVVTDSSQSKNIIPADSIAEIYQGAPRGGW